MVARLKPGAAISKNFYYNENKVKEGVAICLLAENYPRPIEDLSQHMRLNMLQKLAALNTRTQINSLHISLNFDPSETITADTYKEIAKLYMDKLGFGGQPYLVYQHFDAGHPHLHILTTNIQADATRIDLHHLGIRRSEPARKELEEMFQLVRAEGKRNANHQALKSAYAEKIEYGKKESKRAIGAVVNQVMKNYKYTSIPEFNAILKLYNVWADKGTEQSSTFKHGGLLYHILDAEGRPVGVPIKASLFESKPTLKNLESKFEQNKSDRIPFKARIKSAIDFHFLKATKPSFAGLLTALQKEGIHIVSRQNEEGKIYGLTYIDHKTKSVFNGSDLGKEYAANAIQERCAVAVSKQDEELPVREGNTLGMMGEEEQDRSRTGGLLDVLLEPEYEGNSLPFELRGRKKRKKKRKPNRL